MIELFKQAKEIALAMNKSGVDYAFCGGIAVGIHGHVRATRDIDIIVPKNSIEKIDKVLSPLDWINTSQPMTFEDGITLHRRIKILENDPHDKFMQLDILVPPKELKLLSDTILTDLQGIACWVINQESLIKMKTMAGRVKDIEDLRRLEENGYGAKGII